MSLPCKRGIVERIHGQNKAEYLSNKTYIVLTMKRNQDEFQKNKQYWDIVKTTRIFTDHRESLKWIQTNGHKNVISTSTSSCRKWKVVITSVRQEYKFIEGHHNYKTSTRTTYGGRGQPIDIGKSNNNFRDGKLKCFNCNKYRHMAKKYQLKKKEDNLNVTKKDTLPKTIKECSQWRNERFKRN